jgi:hypothetical protein
MSQDSLSGVTSMDLESKLSDCSFYFIQDKSDDLRIMQEKDLMIIRNYLIKIGVDLSSLILVDKMEFNEANLILTRRNIIWYNGHGAASPDDDDDFPRFTTAKSRSIIQTRLHEKLISKADQKVEMIITVFNCCNNSGLNPEEFGFSKDPSPTIFDFKGFAKVCSSLRGNKAFFDLNGSYFTSCLFRLFNINWVTTINRVNKELSSHQKATINGSLKFQEITEVTPLPLGLLTEFQKHQEEETERQKERRRIMDLFDPFDRIDKSRNDKKRKMSPE